MAGTALIMAGVKARIHDPLPDHGHTALQVAHYWVRQGEKQIVEPDAHWTREQQIYNIRYCIEQAENCLRLYHAGERVYAYVG